MSSTSKLSRLRKVKQQESECQDPDKQETNLAPSDDSDAGVASRLRNRKILKLPVPSIEDEEEDVDSRLREAGFTMEELLSMPLNDKKSMLAVTVDSKKQYEVDSMRRESDVHLHHEPNKRFRVEEEPWDITESDFVELTKKIPSPGKTVKTTAVIESQSQSMAQDQLADINSNVFLPKSNSAGVESCDATRCPHSPPSRLPLHSKFTLGCDSKPCVKLERKYPDVVVKQEPLMFTPAGLDWRHYQTIISKNLEILMHYRAISDRKTAQPSELMRFGAMVNLIPAPKVSYFDKSLLQNVSMSDSISPCDGHSNECHTKPLLNMTQSNPAKTASLRNDPPPEPAAAVASGVQVRARSQVSKVSAELIQLRMSDHAEFASHTLPSENQALVSQSHDDHKPARKAAQKGRDKKRDADPASSQTRGKPGTRGTTNKKGGANGRGRKNKDGPVSPTRGQIDVHFPPLQEASSCSDFEDIYAYKPSSPNIMSYGSGLPTRQTNAEKLFNSMMQEEQSVRKNCNNCSKEIDDLDDVIAAHREAVSVRTSPQRKRTVTAYPDLCFTSSDNGSENEDPCYLPKQKKRERTSKPSTKRKT